MYLQLTAFGPMRTSLELAQVVIVFIVVVVVVVAVVVAVFAVIEITAFGPMRTSLELAQVVVHDDDDDNGDDQADDDADDHTDDDFCFSTNETSLAPAQFRIIVCIMIRFDRNISVKFNIVQSGS